jgi:hypothetical protein
MFSNTFVYGFELGDGVLVDLSFLVHEVLQLYTKLLMVNSCIKVHLDLQVQKKK